MFVILKYKWQIIWMLLCGVILHFLRINFTCQVKLSLWAALGRSPTRLEPQLQPIIIQHHAAQHSDHTLCTSILSFHWALEGTYKEQNVRSPETGSEYLHMITVTCTFLMKWHFNKDARGFEPMIFEFRQDVSILLLECGYYRIYWTCSKKQLNDAVVSWPQKIIKIAGGDNFWLLTIIMPAPLPHKPFVLNSLWLCQFRG